jgi:hypothetical protein
MERKHVSIERTAGMFRALTYTADQASDTGWRADYADATPNIAAASGCMTYSDRGS